MDPYLEQRWGDFHTRLITYMSDELQSGLPRDLRARVEERVYVEAQGGAHRQVIPDVHVHRAPRADARRASSGAVGDGATAVAEPILVRLPEEVTERFILIIDVQSGGQVVTVIEALSPANKIRGKGRSKYVRKQEEYIRSDVNLVEIDLVRVGRPTTYSSRLDLIPREKVAPYHVSTCRAERSDVLEYYPLPLRQRLPKIPIPLRETDPDAVLDLQALVDTAYDRGRYDDIDYARALEPPLQSADEVWVKEILNKRS